MAYSKDLEHRVQYSAPILGGHITITIDGTGTAEVRAQVEGIRQKAGDLSVFWAAAESYFFDSEYRTFMRSGYPETWPPLAASTLARKKGPGILRETDRMFRSVTSHTSDTIYEYSARNVSFGTRVEYAPYHMTGTSRMPARPFVQMAPESYRALTAKLVEWLLDAKVPMGAAPRESRPV